MWLGASNRSITKPVVPLPPGTFNAAFGHYLCNGFAKADKTQNLNILDATVGTSCRGIQLSMRPYSYDRGTSGPNYAGDSTRTWGRPFIQDILDHAQSIGKYVMIVIEERSFGGATPGVPGSSYPPWWYNFDTYHQSTSSSSSSTQGWIIVNTWFDSSAPPPGLISRGTPQSIATMYNPATMNAYRDLVIDMALAFGSHPALVMIGASGESAISVGFTNSQLTTYYSRVLGCIQGIRAAVPNVPLRWQLNNFSDPDIQPILPQYAAMSGVWMGGPDPEGQNAHGSFPADPGTNPANLDINRIIQGWDRYRGQSGSTWPTSPGWGPDYRGQVGFVSEFQAFDTVGRTPSPLALYHVASLIPQKNQYSVWGLASGNAGFSQSSCLAFINSIGGAPNYSVAPTNGIYILH